MPSLDELPGEIIVPTRDESIQKWKRDFRVRVPESDPADPQLDVEARVNTDSILPILAAAKTIGSNCVLEDATGEKAVKQWGEREGVPGPSPATGATGSVLVVASDGGFDVIAGIDELLHEPTGNTYVVTRTQHFVDGDPCPIAGVDTGPSSNLDGGSVLKWKSPRPGCGLTATVITQNDGTGLTGGRDAQTPIAYREQIRAEKTTRPASGNDADYQRESAATPNIAIQKVFTYPAIKGAGTTAVTFTLKPSRPGGSRIPNSAQVAAVEENVVGAMPGDDGAFFCLLAESLFDVVYKVTWHGDAAGWADVSPWPKYYAAAGQAVVVQSAASATSFILKTYNSNYSGVTSPQVGQTIAFFSQGNLEFVRKRILSVSGSGPWTITVDPANNSSDLVFIPSVGQRAMPWSESLEQILAPLFEYIDGIGPGEQFVSFYDEGIRQKRQPPAPREWPHTLTRKGLETALDIDEIEDGSLVEGDGSTPPPGTPGVLSYLLRLRFVSVFPE